MKNWYLSLNKKQKVFVYFLAIVMPFLAAGTVDSPILLFPLYIPLIVFIFIELGKK